MSIEQLTAWSIKRRELEPNLRHRLARWLSSTAPNTPSKSVLLQTCERVEWFALSGPPLLPPPSIPVRHRRGAHAARHVFRVAAGLDSHFTGETQIVWQIRCALDMAPDPELELVRLFRAAIRTGNRARSHSGLDSQITSYARLAANRAVADGRRIGVIGTGSLAEDVLRSLKTLEVVDLTLFGSHAERVGRLARVCGAKARLRTDLPAVAAHLDCLVTCIASPTPIDLAASRPRRSMLRIIDLGEPTNAYTGLAGNQYPSIVTLDDLSAARTPRSGAVALAERIAAEGAAAFLSRSIDARSTRLWRGSVTPNAFARMGALA